MVSDVVSDVRYWGSVGSYARHGRRLAQRYKGQKGFSFGTRGSERVYGETLCASLTHSGGAFFCLSVCLLRARGHMAGGGVHDEATVMLIRHKEGVRTPPPRPS